MKDHELKKNIYNEIKSENQNYHQFETPKYKEYRRRWSVNPIEHIVGDFPIHIDFELTTYCNLKCIKKICTLKCPYELPDKQSLPKINFDLELFKKVIDEGVEKGFCSIKLNYRGEPLLHPKIIEFVKYAKKKGIIDIMLNTNASLLTEERINGLLDSGLDKLFCTLGSISEDQIDLIRGKEAYDAIIKNINHFILAKNKKKLFKPVLTIQIFDLNTSKEEKDKFINEWKEKVNNIAFDKISKFILVEEFHPGRTKFICQYLWQRLFILYNGDVVMCCGNHKDIHVLGNIEKHTIESIWKGENLNKIRNLHLNNKSGDLEICRKCGFRKIMITNMN